MIIVEDSAGNRFEVRPPRADGLAHCWSAVAVKRGKRGSGQLWVAKAKANWHLIRREGCKVVWSNEP